MRKPAPANDNEGPSEHCERLIASHIAFAEFAGVTIDNLGWSIDDDAICSTTSGGPLTSEYKGDLIVHTLD